jgi:hypothetical protein
MTPGAQLEQRARTRSPIENRLPWMFTRSTAACFVIDLSVNQMKPLLLPSLDTAHRFVPIQQSPMPSVAAHPDHLETSSLEPKFRIPQFC